MTASLDVEEERDLVALAMSPAAMGSRLSRLHRVDPAGRCQVVDAKYEARRSASVLYQVGTTLVNVVVGLAARTGRPAAGTEIGPHMSAFVFPADPVLASLGTVLRPPVLAGLIGDALGERVASCGVQVLRYRPAKRATLDVRARIGPPGHTAALRLVAKVYSSASKAAAVYDESRGLEAFATPGSAVSMASLSSEPRLALASAVAFVADVPMILQSPLSGAGLDGLLSATPSGRPDPRAEAGVAAAAEVMAALHRLPPVSTRARSSDKELRRFAERAGRIAEVDAACGEALCEVAAALAESYRGLPAAPVGLVHGDCKPSQFLIGTASVGLLDFDHCGLADPASDVGAFLAALRKSSVVQSLRGPRRPRPELGLGRSRLERVFLETYGRDATDRTDLEARVTWHQAAALVRKALRAFARAPRSALPLALAAESTRCLREPAGVFATHEVRA